MGQTAPEAGEEAEEPADPVDRVLDALAEVFVEDAAIAAGGSAGEGGTDALRDALLALVDDARAAGEDLDRVARRLSFSAAKRFGKEIPAAYQGQRGLLASEALLRSVGAEVGDVSDRQRYLATIQREGSGTVVESAEPAPAQAPRAAEAPAAQEPEPEPVRTIVVQQGDSLGTIAERVYGDMLAYRRIYVANRDVIDNPNLLQPGMTLRLPE